MSEITIAEYSLFTALITPFDDQGNVDFDDLLTLLKQQETAGNGILILGSTGEALNMNLAAREDVVDFTLEQNLQVPIMVGVGGILLEETLAWVQWLEDKAIDALLMVTPLYAKPGRHGQTQWFKTLLDATSKTSILYNVPSRTASELHLGTVEDLLDHPNFFGIKEASGSITKFRQYLDAATDKFMYCGDDALMPEFASAGAQGLISVASNVWPEPTNAYVKLNLEGNFHDASLWQAATNALFMASNPVPAKRLLEHTGVIKSAYLQPPLNARDLTDLSYLTEQDRLIKDWFKRHI